MFSGSSVCVDSAKMLATSLAQKKVESIFWVKKYSDCGEKWSAQELTLSQKSLGYKHESTEENFQINLISS